MLTQEQIKQIKNQLLKQLESWPEDQRESAKEQIEAMSDEELEQFLIKNKLIRSNEDSESHKSSNSRETEEKEAANQCTFCLLASGKIPVYKLDENKQAIAILEINPVSKGHVLIIPKNHIKATKMHSSALSLAKKIAKKLESKLKPKPKKIDLATTELFQHGIINIIPVYNNENLGSERKKASESELKELQEKLALKSKVGEESSKKVEKISMKKRVHKEIKLQKAPKRIP
ncbi:HIT domain-containing protein [Candidatus Pacearchaeota archaeon]|nr:HIT domain-containing protein [Candidatus Pacearchaeota archaeon]